MSAALEIACPECEQHVYTDECPRCRGEHTIVLDPGPESIATPWDPYALERVEHALRSHLLRSRVIGAEHRARVLSRALLCIPEGGNAAACVREATGLTVLASYAVVELAAAAVLEHARVIEARDRYRRDRIAQTKIEAAKLREIAKRIDPDVRW